ncbi:MAG: hypothetical protein IJU29_08035, partial [Oscillospiraceae bacterium]|nr:hypothetical protein [Oscillospiraceae bacterium]
NAAAGSPERDAAALRRAAVTGDFPAALEAADRSALRMLPAEERSAALDALSAEIEALELSGAADSVLAAPESGFLFFDTDGFEALSPDGELTAGALWAALGAKSAELPGVLRLVTGSGWLLCVPMTEEEAALFAPGDTETAELRGQSLRVKTKSVLAGPGAERWVLFSCREGLEAVSSVRTVQVSLVLRRAEGYLLPAAALRREDGETVVYRMAGPVVRREAVTVLAEDGESVLVDGDGLRPGALVLTGKKEYTDGAVP